jgi:hypothetical protein
MNPAILTYEKRKPVDFFIKRLVFLFLRMRQKIRLYDGITHETGHRLRLVHVGNVHRGRAFIQGLFGHTPQHQDLGTRFSWSPPSEIPFSWLPCDILLLEANRLRAENFRQAGYFTVPEWVEFGRQVVADPSLRYHGASKSLKSDLNKIRSSPFTVAISKERRDFDTFYENMYLPHVRQRYGDGAIIKGKRILEKDFRSGFLFLLGDGRRHIAGALVREEGDVITETTLGVLAGADEVLRMGVSGAIDYHLLDWAAACNKTYMNVGHTRPFPHDGVFRNKKKWLMTISPDMDGVMDMAIKIRRFDSTMAAILRQWPFVFHTDRGLSVFCGHDGSEQAGEKEIDRLVQHHALAGLQNLIMISATGYKENALSITGGKHPLDVHLFSDIHQAVAWQLGARTGFEA